MEVVKSKRNPDRSITQTIWVSNGESEEKRYSTIYGGVSWPSATLPAYFSILGEEYIEGIDHSDEKKARGKLALLSEYQATGLSLSTLFDKLIDDCILYGCNSIYSTINDAHEEFKLAFWDHTKKRKQWKLSLKSAPYADNFILGMSLLQDWQQRFDFPDDSILFKQLKSLTKESLNDSPETKFNAINSLRFAVAAFESYPETHKVYRVNTNYHLGSDNSWMGK